jgi:hypothetical protein
MSKELTVECPNCKTLVNWSEENPDRPFCSARCRNIDFCGWAQEEHLIKGNSQYDDLFSGDLEQ